MSALVDLVSFVSERRRRLSITVDWGLNTLGPSSLGVCADFSQTYWALRGEVWWRPLPKFAAFGFEPQAIGKVRMSKLIEEAAGS
jgi:hypothetical protein